MAVKMFIMVMRAYSATRNRANGPATLKLETSSLCQVQWGRAGCCQGSDKSSQPCLGSAREAES